MCERKEPDNPAPGTFSTFSERVYFTLLTKLINAFFKVGNLTISFKDLPSMKLGDGSGEAFLLHFRDKSDLVRMLYKPSLNIGEVFMDGGWSLEQGDLGRFMGVLLKNEELMEEGLVFRTFDKFSSFIGHTLTVNSIKQSHQNVQHHYDIGNDLYKSFLDEKMLYSCAFFDDNTKTLEDAQDNKISTTLSRLNVSSGMAVLEIGCGWGAMSKAIADTGANATGITLSQEQLAYANQHNKEQNSTFLLEDYRDHAQNNPESYDRIVSIGMFEHVGRRHYQDFFDAIKNLLKPGGRAVIHSIVKDTTTQTNPWLRKYIFPGGQAPRILDMTEAALASGLKLPHAPYEHAGFNYAETLRHWRKRFIESWPELSKNGYDERFKRMWLFYLAGSEASFEALGTRVAQVIVEKPLSS